MIFIKHLWFPNYQSNSVVFSQSIEVKTKRVDKELIWTVISRMSFFMSGLLRCNLFLQIHLDRVCW